MNEHCRPDCTYCNPPEERCDRCKAAFRRDQWGRQGGMRVEFNGWYGGTIDPFVTTDVLLCDSCARLWLTRDPWLGEKYEDLRVFEKEGSGHQ